jgi:hypothetical protein
MNKTPVIMYDCHGASNQMWIFEPDETVRPSLAARPLLDRNGLGVFGGIHHTTEPGEFRPQTWVARDVPEAQLEVFAESHAPRMVGP